MACAEVTGGKVFDNSDDSPNPPPTGAYTIREFARAHGISEDMFYKMQRDGWGPATMKVGSRTLISVEAAAAWRRAREATQSGPAPRGAAKKNRDRRKAADSTAASSATA